ncbi:DNA/RNA helicase domain-containing protein [Bordetella genomosp. 4]|uniref:DNA/RNA helicase domain-containing protein n=1 Tax=Bordetella genomosp. 4 TaxID=463044 RepID=UPI00359C63D1
MTNAEHRVRHDKTILGYKTRLKTDHDRARSEANLIIKNTYRTLMTRGMKGCYVYCTDKETAEYFRSRINEI